MEELLRDIAETPLHDGTLCPDPELLKEAIGRVMVGDFTPSQLGALLMGLRIRGERAEHLKAVVEVLLEHATPFHHKETMVFDTCGTGGDQHGMINVSTAAGLLAAAAGIAVAKHGNRAVSSKSGSADVLEALGIKIDCAPKVSESMLGLHRFCFLFAPSYHPAMRHAGPIRREVKFRSIFNLAGPLSNPARPTHQLVGVSERRLIQPMIETLKMLGRRQALVVHGRNGEDEISLTQVTEALHLREDGSIHSMIIDPAELNLQPAEMADLVVRDAIHSAERIRAIFAGEVSPAADLINMNLAAVLLMAGREKSYEMAFNHAREIQQSGVGAKFLDAIAHTSQQNAV